MKYFIFFLILVGFTGGIVSQAYAQTNDRSVVSFTWVDDLDHENTLGNIGEMCCHN